jgi:DNA mismatch repair ATPase MutS
MEQELKDKQSDLIASFEKLEKELDGLDKKEPSKRDKAISKIENHIDEIKEAISAFEYDILEQDLNNSSDYENYKREFEKKLADMKQLFKIKRDPNYLQKLQIKQEVSGAGPSDSILSCFFL